MQPVIKWSGSKRSQAKEILKEFPREIEVYHEPFCGSASMMWALIHSDIRVGRYKISDKNKDLISLWKYILEDPGGLSRHYKELWGELTEDEDKERKKAFYRLVRERFNKEKDPRDFMFIMRTTMNGMPRYNLKGEFNNSFHISRNGMRPESLEKIISKWNRVMVEKEIEFECKDYRDIREVGIDDYIYLDPPYAGTKGMYYGGIDLEELWNWLENIKCGYTLSFDGKSGEVDNTYQVPRELYQEHKYIYSGISSFKRIVGKGDRAEVYESIYTKKTERGECTK